MDDTHSEHTLGDLFEQTFGVENKAAQLYGKFSEFFSHVSDVAAFWRGLAEDERTHITILQDILKALTEEQLSSPLERKVWRNVLSVHDLLDADLTAPIRTLDDAYEVAHQLEFSEINSIFKFLANEVVPSKERRRILLSSLDQHQNKLMDFNHEFGNRGWRKTVGRRQTTEDSRPNADS